MRSRLDSRPGLAPTPTPGPGVPCRAAWGLTHTTPRPGLLGGVLWAGGSAPGEGAALRGGGRGALSHPALWRDPHRDLTSCHQESGRWVPGSADTCGHNDKLESGFSRPPALPAWRNRDGQQPASKKGALE